MLVPASFYFILLIAKRLLQMIIGGRNTFKGFYVNYVRANKY